MIVWNKSREDLYALKIIQRGTKNEPALPNDTCTISLPKYTEKLLSASSEKAKQFFFFEQKKTKQLKVPNLHKGTNSKHVPASS